MQPLSQLPQKRLRTWRARVLPFPLALPYMAAYSLDRYHPHLVQTLSKWSNKIQSVAPSALLPSNRNAFTKSPRNELKNAVQLISESFSDQTSWAKMVDRTRVYRGKGERIGSKLPSQTGEPDPELFDDTDLYQQLLRDVIDARSGGSGSHDWIQAQKERKKKKAVDTKASKGRRIR
jgi:protein AATF/BFR2